MMAFFLLTNRNIKMSKRYSGKSFKDSSVKKQPKLNLKEKRRIKKEKQKNQIKRKITNKSEVIVVFFKFAKLFISI